MTPDEVRRFRAALVRLKQDGAAFGDLGPLLGVSVSTVYRWASSAGGCRPSPLVEGLVGLLDDLRADSPAAVADVLKVCRVCGPVDALRVLFLS